VGRRSKGKAFLLLVARGASYEAISYPANDVLREKNTLLGAYLFENQYVDSVRP
jgi:hypothetical protein